MPNFIDPNRVTQYAAEIAAAAGLGGDLASRFVEIAGKFMRGQADCAKPLVEIGGDAPDWARRSAVNGELVQEFHPTTEVTERLRNAATGLMHISQAGDGPAGRGRSLANVVDRLGRMNFCQLEKAIADWVVRKTRERFTDPDIERCPAARIDVASGRVWTRVTTLRQLDDTGAALRNCLARAHPRHKAHWQALSDGSAEYWRLRCRQGRLVCALEVETGSRIVRDVRARENTVPAAYEADIRQLMVDLSLRSPPVAEFDGSEALFSLGLVGPATERAQPDVEGKMARTNYKLWVNEDLAVIRIGQREPETVVVDTRDFPRRFGLALTCSGYSGPADVVPVLVNAARQKPAALKPMWRAFVLAADSY